MVAILVGAATTPAQASDFSVSTSETNLLPRVDASVSLTIAGLPSGDGIYVRECVAPETVGTRPTTCASIADTVWTSLDTNSQNQGAQVFSGTVVLPAKISFTTSSQIAVNCETSSCGILVRRDHLGPTDFSLDTFIPITFAAPFSVSVSKTAQIVAAGETISVNVAGLTVDQGVYVRLCKESAVGGERPSICDGQGVWASVSKAMQAVGAVNASAAIELPARAKFGTGANAVDCSVSVCGVFVRRDHLAPADYSLDKFIPVTFTAVPITVVQKKIAVSVMNHELRISLKGYAGSKLSLKIGNKVTRFTPSSNSFSFKRSLLKGSGVKIQLLAGKTVLLTKRVRG